MARTGQRSARIVDLVEQFGRVGRTLHHHTNTATHCWADINGRPCLSQTVICWDE